jgi:hypothetical protein
MPRKQASKGLLKLLESRIDEVCKCKDSDCANKAMEVVDEVWIANLGPQIFPNWTDEPWAKRVMECLRRASDAEGDTGGLTEEEWRAGYDAKIKELDEEAQQHHELENAKQSADLPAP